jgi:hypothetical protein
MKRTSADVRHPKSRSAPEPAPASWRIDLVAGLAASVAAVVVFHGSIAYFFAQDDFAALARASGLLPRFAEPWRLLSLQLYFDAMRPLAGLNPTPYHLVSLAGHAIATALVHRLARATVGPAAAMVGAFFFACHPSSFTAVYWISTVGDVYAVVLGLSALLLARRDDRLRLAAPVAFAAALLCKESVLLLPLAVPLARRAGRAGVRAGWRDPVVLAMVFTAAAWLGWFALRNELGAVSSSPDHAPYAASLGPHVVANALTYLGWTANFLLPTVTGFSDAVDPAVHGYGWALALAILAGAFLPALRRRGWIAAASLYALLLLPVLPLANHTYHYYLYASLVGAAWGVACAVDALPARRVAAWVVAGALALALAVNGRALVRKIESFPFTLPGTRSEPLVDRALIAEKVVRGVAGASYVEGTTLRLVSPEALALEAAGGPGTYGPGRETYWERNVRSALYEGLAIRLFVPPIARVEFVRGASAEGERPVRHAAYRVTGETRVLGAAELDSLFAPDARGPEAGP